MVTTTICKVGCLMSSTSMALAGNSILIDGKIPANPGTVNTWLKDNNGYDSTNDFEENAKHRNIVRLANTRAIKLLFRDNDASGVECKNLLTNANTVVNARKIVLSAGTIFSPFILMQSGIGDPKDVNKAGVPLKIKQEHVGKHMRDHAIFRIEFDSTGFDTLNQKTRGLKLLIELTK